MRLRVLTIREAVLPISAGFATGRSDCSSNDVAWPSQPNRFGPNVYAALMNDGVLRIPACPPTPFANRVPFENARAGTWHVAHETVASADSRLSKKSQRPRRTRSGAGGLGRR